jgi:pyruvate dehydrogenase E1 component beta subunit
MSQRVIENLNAALGRLLREHEDLYHLGEDIADPYGGAFKATRGLSTEFPDRVLTTPISEAAIVAAANGLALSGEKAIAEMMFGDFICLAFDQIVNFAAKSVSMYGEPQAHPMIVRCPTGGNRGYGATHSQSLQKHFIGVPDLSLYELSPFHDCHTVLDRILSTGKPAVHFENKLLYGREFSGEGDFDGLFRVRFKGPDNDLACVQISDASAIEGIVLTPGGSAHACLEAARELFLEEEIETRVFVPSQIYPLELDSVREQLAACEQLFVVEEGTAGGTWGAEVAQAVQKTLGRPRAIELIHAADGVIPAARSLEKEMLPQAGSILKTMRDVFGAN